MDRLRELLSRLSYLDLKDDIVDRQEHATSLGGSCDVYSAWSRRFERRVAVKQIRVFMRKDRAFAKQFTKEIRIWQSLNHENVLPLLGYYFVGDNMMPNLVSEWMVNGTLYVYIKKLPFCGNETRRMLHGISCGLAYLHARGVIHADLKSQNVLISSRHTPLLADFGVSLALQHSHSISMMTSTSYGVRGSVRWMAPELLSSQTGVPPRHTAFSDMWAFGMIAYELLSGDVPYVDMKSDVMVMIALTRMELPTKPLRFERDDAELFETIWDFCHDCWTVNITRRPTANHAVGFWSAEHDVPIHIFAGTRHRAQIPSVVTLKRLFWSPLLYTREVLIVLWVVQIGRGLVELDIPLSDVLKEIKRDLFLCFIIVCDIDYFLVTFEWGDLGFMFLTYGRRAVRMLKRKQPRSQDQSTVTSSILSQDPTDLV